MEKVLKVLAYIIIIAIATVSIIIEAVIKLLLLPIGIVGFLIVFLFWPIFQNMRQPGIVDFFYEYVFTTKWVTTRIINYYTYLIHQM